MATTWLKEWETRAKVICMIVMEQFITMLPEEVRVWVKEHKPGTSLIAGKITSKLEKQQMMTKSGQRRSHLMEVNVV